MSTHSTVKFIESKRNICSVYQQWDGYLSCVGLELAHFLDGTKIINGISGQSTGYANGMGCLAAQYIARIKTGIGGVYMTNPKDKQEYNYIVEGDGTQPLSVTVKREHFIKNKNKDGSEEYSSVLKTVFTGNVKEFLAFCEAEEN